MGVLTDTYGNAMAVLNPEGSPKIMVEGNADNKRVPGPAHRRRLIYLVQRRGPP